MERSIKELQEALKSNLGHVFLNGRDDQRRFATMTSDLEGCLFKDVGRDEIEEIEREDVNACASNQLGATATMVTGKFSMQRRPFLRDDVGGHIFYTLHHKCLKMEDIRKLPAKSMSVKTNVVGKFSHGIFYWNKNKEIGVKNKNTMFDAGDEWRKGNFVPVLPDLASVEDEYGLRNELLCTTSKTGILVNEYMTTEIPLNASKDTHDAILEAREDVRAYLVLLSVLNGGFPVEVQSLDLVYEDGSSSPIHFVADPSEYKILGKTIPENKNSSGWTDTDYRQGVKTYRALDELVKNSGVRKWLDWWKTNPELVDAENWQTDRALALLEGLYGEKFCELNWTSLGMEQADAKWLPSALIEANNHRKHLRRYDKYGQDYQIVENFVERCSVYTSYLIVYGVLDRSGILPMSEELQEKWPETIKSFFIDHVKNVKGNLPKSFWEKNKKTVRCR